MSEAMACDKLPVPTREEVATKLQNLAEGPCTRSEAIAWAKHWLLRYPVAPMDLTVRRGLRQLLSAGHTDDAGEYSLNEEETGKFIRALRLAPVEMSPLSPRRGRPLSELQLDELYRELVYLYDQQCIRAFPYEDIRRLQEGRGTRYNNLVFDLDWYDGELAGHMSWRSRVVEWDTERRESTRIFASVASSITSRNTGRSRSASQSVIRPTLQRTLLCTRMLA